MGSRLAAGAPGVGPRRPLAEGGGLALAGAALLVEQPRQPLNLGFQLGDAALQRLAAGAGMFVHARMVAKREAGLGAREGESGGQSDQGR
jgi:hypothetical protein